MGELREQTFNCFSNEGWKTVNEEGIGVWKRLPLIKDDDYQGMGIQCILQFRRHPSRTPPQSWRVRPSSRAS